MERPPDDITPPDLARMAVELFITESKTLDPPRAPAGVLAQQAGAFVTLRTVDGDLRGCIGTIASTCETIAEEIIQNAISAATRDPRFSPVEAGELPRLTYGVDLLSPREAARGPEDLDPSHYGVVIETLDGARRGLLLPRIEGIETVEQQWLAVHRKAGIPVGTPVKVERFSVTRFGKD
ncbi:MAG TPA: AmmeMemoRadiSam system protein A [Blastocatellia bacterium]|nr:AmmeMemoRadiSam system protein A [Blastocatellia bacterium]